MDLREKILSVDDTPIKKINVPEWNCDVYIKPLTGKMQDEFDMIKFAENDKGEFKVAPNITAKYLQKTLCDENGKLLFTEADIEMLGSKSALVNNRLYQAAVTSNGATAQAQEELEKNLNAE